MISCIGSGSPAQLRGYHLRRQLSIHRNGMRLGLQVPAEEVGSAIGREGLCCQRSRRSACRNGNLVAARAGQAIKLVTDSTQRSG